MNETRFTYRAQRQRRRQRGSVMVLALVVLGGLVALLALIAADQYASVQKVQQRMQQRRALLATRAAVVRALATLQAGNPNVVTLNDTWATIGQNGDTLFDMGDGTSHFRMQIVDAGSRLNINTVTQAELQQLPLTPEQIDSLTDWRTTGEQPAANGAKDDYYNALKTPYNAKLGRFNTLDELLLVKGWTGQVLYNTDQVNAQSTSGVTLEDADGNPLPLIDVLTADSGTTNLQASGSARINFNSRNINPRQLTQLGISQTDAAAIVAGAPYANFSALLRTRGITSTAAQRLLNSATFSTAAHQEGKINLNTAPQAVLQTITNVTPDIASAIVQQQSSGFTSLGSLSTIAGLSSSARLAQIADAFTVGSDTFIVRAYGTSGDTLSGGNVGASSGGTGVAVEVVVGIRNNKARILTWNTLPNGTVPAWWNWHEETTQPAGSGDNLDTGTTTTTASSGTGGGQ